MSKGRLVVVIVLAMLATGSAFALGTELRPVQAAHVRTSAYLGSGTASAALALGRPVLRAAVNVTFATTQ